MKKTLLLAIAFFLLAQNAYAVINEYNADYANSGYLNVTGYNHTNGVNSATNFSDDIYFGLNDSNAHVYANKSPFLTVCGVDNADATIPFCRIFNYTGESVTNRTATDIGSSAAEWYVLKGNPFTNELFLCISDAADDLKCQNFNGSTWTSTFTMTTNDTTVDARSFDINFESKSGRAVIVYSVNVADTLAYRYWNQSSWSKEYWLTMTSAATLSWVRLVADPNSNNMTVVAQNSRTDGQIFTARWNGTSSTWSASQNVTAGTAAGSDSSAVGIQAFDAAYNNESAALIVYSNNATVGAVFAKMFWPNQTLDAQALVGYGGADQVKYVSAASMPGSSRIGYCWIDNGGGTTTDDLLCNEWEYSRNFTQAEPDSTIDDDTSTQGRQMDVVAIEEIGGWAVPYADNGVDMPTIARCLSKSDCQAGTWGTNTMFTGPSPAADMRHVRADTSVMNKSQAIVGWKNIDTTAPSETFWGMFYCHSGGCALKHDTDSIQPATASAALFATFDVAKDEYSNYTLETWFNSTPTTDVPAGATIESVNATVEFKSAFPGNFSTYIYNWSNSQWNFCQSQVVTANTELFLNCSVCSSGCLVTGDPVNFTDSVGNAPKVIRISLNETIHNLAINESNVSIDYVNFNVTYSNPQANAALRLAQFRLWESSSTTIGQGALTDLKCNTTSSFGANILITPGGISCNNTAPSKSYRAEIRVCNDGASGANQTTFDYINHRFLSTQYLGALTANDCGHGDNGSAWNGTLCNSYSESSLLTVQIANESAGDKHYLPSGDGSTRDDNTCEYYAYRFTTGAPDWVITDNSRINTTGASNGSNPAPTENANLNVTYSETAFSLYYPSTGCTSGKGSDGRLRARYYNETCVLSGSHGCDVQNATFQNFNDTTTKANVTITAASTDTLYYNFTGINGMQGNIYWTNNVTNGGQDTFLVHFWDWVDGRWEQVDSRTNVAPTTNLINLSSLSTNYLSGGFLNVSLNGTTEGVDTTTFLYDIYYHGDHSDKCARCYFQPATANSVNVACEGQTSSTSFLDLQNLGSVIEAWKVYLSSALPEQTPGGPRALAGYYHGASSTAPYLNPAYRVWSSAGWGSETNATTLDAGSDIEWLVNKCDVANANCIMATLDDEGEVQAQAYTAGAWGSVVDVAPNIGTTNDQSRGFDVAFEQTRGWGLVIAGNNSARPYYRIWYPENNTWTGVEQFPNSACGASGTPIWLDAVSKPGSNEILTAYRDDAGRVCGYVWDGSSWGNSRSINNGSAETTQKTVCAAYEESSGKGIVFYEEQSSANLNYANWTGSAWEVPAAICNPACVAGSEFVWFACASMPGTNRIMWASQEHSVGAEKGDLLKTLSYSSGEPVSKTVIDWSEYVSKINSRMKTPKLSYVTGTLVARQWDRGFGTEANFPSTIEDDLSDRPMVDVAYIGGSGHAMMVYAADTNFPNYRTCTSSANCQAGTWGSASATTASACATGAQVDLVRLYADSATNDTMLLYSTQHANEPICAQLYNGTTATWGSVTNLEDTNRFLANARPFDVFFYNASASGGSLAMFMNDSSATHLTLSTTQQTWNASVEQYEHSYAWLWANYTSYDSSTHENYLVSNTSTS
ncbi:MAG: hypothetical protein QXR53_03005 [Candidatus Norongarragalinales archaeon]